MEDFAAKVIAAHQAGLSEYRTQQEMERTAESHKLNVQQAKLTLDSAKLQQALHERELQAMTSGGPTGQATTTIQQPTTQPANSPLPPPTPMPSTQPQNIQDLLMRGRGQAQPQMAPIPSGQDTSLNTSVPTGVPPAGPDIPVQLSDGRTITVPGTNQERELASAMAAKIQEMKLEGLKPFNVGKGDLHVNPLEGTTISNPEPTKYEAKEGTFNGLATTANYDPETGDYSIGGQKLPPGSFKPKEGIIDNFAKLDLASYLKHPELTSKYGADQTGYDNWKQAQKLAESLAARAPKDTSLQEANALERSYNARNTEIGKKQTLVDTGLTNIGQAKDLLAQNNPGANSIVAPAIIKAVVGGAGSGVRITTPEINAINGGRGKILNFESWLSSWSTDPNKYQALLPEQKVWLNGVLDKISQKLTAKQAAISDASQSLIDAPDAKTHKQIVKDLNDKLEGVDIGTVNVQIPGHPPGQIPAGNLKKFLADNPGSFKLP